MRRRALTRLLLASNCLFAPRRGSAEEAWSLASPGTWQPQPTWLANPSTAAKLAPAGEGLTLTVSEPNRGMKWQRPAELDDFDLFPWLVIRYRARHVAAATDYLLWLGDSGPGRDGVRLISGGQARADGEWHTLAFDLARLGVVAPVSRLAVGVTSDAAGEATVEIARLAQVDVPPADAERLPTEAPAGWTRDVPVTTDWTVQPKWLGNPAADASLSLREAALRFQVPTPGTGAKWSHGLDESITGAKWVLLRYRAHGCAPGSDYALYLANAGGGAAPEEQDAVTRAELVTDGAWHVAVAPVRVSAIRTLAVQVQAEEPDAWLEIGRIAFSQTRPAPQAADLVALTPGWDALLTDAKPVALPPGNGDAACLAGLLGLASWTATGRVTAEGVPFELAAGIDLARLTPLRDVGDLVVPLTGRGAELYLLLAARLPSTEEPSYNNATVGVVRHVERFVARVEYADGTVDEQMPFSLRAGRPQVSAGVGVYAVALFPDKQPTRLVLRDGYRRGAFGLLAATLSGRQGPASAATVPVVTPAQPSVPWPEPNLPGTVATRDGSVWATARSIWMRLDFAPGLRIASWHGRFEPRLRPDHGPARLFTLQVGEKTYTADDFRPTGLSRSADGREVDIELVRVGEPSLRVMCAIRTNDSGGIELRVRLLDGLAGTVTLPELAGLDFGPATSYCFPRRGAAIGSSPIRLREPYSGSMPLQFVDVYEPSADGGLCLETDDTTTPREYYLSKQNGKVDVGIRWKLAVGGEARATLWCHPGDWHAAFDRYRQWAAENIKPTTPPKPWFREAFNFRQQFLHFDLPERSGMFDAATRSLHLPEVLAQDAAAFGGCDYLHLFDWGWDPVHGRCGDYRPWDYLGPPERLRQQVQAVRAAGTPVGIYLEGYLVDPQSDLGKAHGREWQLLGPDGKPYDYFAPSYNLCPAVPAWQDALAAAYTRAKAETGAVGFYVDEIGFANPMHDCYNPAHGHALGVGPMLGEQAMLRKIRAAIGPESALYTEESPPDATTALQDGSFTYAIASVSDTWSPTHVNLYRFAFPWFKTFEIITCDHPLGSNVEAVKRVAFNGEGIWLEGIADKWFTPEVRATIAAYHTVLRRRRDCFAGPRAEPLVPTLRVGVYANRFDATVDGRGNACWTVYNTNWRTAQGQLLEIAHVDGARYRDELSGRDLLYTARGRQDVLELTVAPRDVVVVSRVP